MTAPTTTAPAMVDMLRRHYLPEGKRPAGIFLPEIVAPASTRRADLIWQGVTIADRLLVGHEIKCNRQDVLVELADGTKAHAWQQYCDRWWLVIATPSLIDGLDVPDSWGVMAPPSGRRTRTMTVLRPAPLLHPPDQAEALRVIALRQHWDAYNAVAAAAQEHAYTQRQVSYLERQVADLQEAASQGVSVDPLYRDQARVVREVIDALGGVHGGITPRIGDWHHQVSVDDVIAALRDLGGVRHRLDEARRDLSYQDAEIRRRIEAMQRLLNERATAAPAAVAS